MEILDLDPVHLRHIHVVAFGVKRVGIVRLTEEAGCSTLADDSAFLKGRGNITNGSIGTVGGCNLMSWEPKFGKSLGLGGSSWPDGLTLSVV